MVHQHSGPGMSAERSAVSTRRGLVCSPSPLAAAAGVEVLRSGGNAFDAAIAVAAAECVTLPPLCGLGGEMFALLYEASTGRLYGLTGSGKAPMAATRGYFVERGYRKMPLDGPLSPSVPGEVHAWDALQRRFGSRPLGHLLQPAVRLAEEGFPILPLVARYYTQHLAKLSKFPSTAAILTNGGRPLQAGHVLVQKDLAHSLRRIADEGAQEFYTGQLAQDLTTAVQLAGGLIAAGELEQQTTIIYESPPSATYRGHTVFTNALPSQGYLILELLNILEGYDLKGMGHNSPDAIHTMVEAVKMVFADRVAYVGDPQFVDVPMDRLLSREFAGQRRGRLDPTRAAQDVRAGSLVLAADGGAGDTSYFCVVDAAGNAVSLIHSLSNAFGSGFITGETGVLLNNRLGRGFSLEEGHPNVLEPGKRTINTIQTYMAFGDDGSLIVGGTPGGDNQAQFNVQALSNLLDHGMDVQQAADALRWSHFPGTDPANVDQPYELRVEDGLPPETLAELERRGHRLASMSATAVSGAIQLICISPDGTRAGGSDSRIDGSPVAE